MNNGKANRRLRNLWYKKDLVGWIDLKVKLKRYPKNTEANDAIFKLEMTIWNSRFTHEEIQLTHYKDWHPYCCNELTPCASRAWDRMEIKSYGWYCPFCGMKLGKHLYTITPVYDGIKSDTWDNRSGLFMPKPNIGFPMEITPSIYETDLIPRHDLSDYITAPKPLMMVGIK